MPYLVFDRGCRGSQARSSDIGQARDPMAGKSPPLASGGLGIFYAGFPEGDATGRNLNYWALWTGYKF